MRTYLVVLAIILLAFSQQAVATDVLLGTVVSTEPESGTLVIRPAGAGKTGDKETETAKDITVRVEKNSFPKHLEPGGIIRVWGDFAKDHKLKFDAKRIDTSHFPKHKKDPTGVRSRLIRGRRPGRGPARPPHGRGPAR